MNKTKIMNEKARMIGECAKRLDDMSVCISLQRYYKLDMDDFKEICSFNSNDWMDFGSCKDQELMDNRNPEDRPEGADDNDVEILSPELFAKVAKGFFGKKLTYDLYLKMRISDGM